MALKTRTLKTLIPRFLDNARTVVFSLLRVRTLGAIAIPVDGDGNVVLVRLTYGKKGWRLPGGGLHRHETFRDAALREAREEAGVYPTKDTTVELLGLYYRYIGGWFDNRAVYVIEHVELRESKSWEVEEVGLFDPDNLPSDTAPGVCRRIDEWRGRLSQSEVW